jgi:hypothetical protein
VNDTGEASVELETDPLSDARGARELSALEFTRSGIKRPENKRTRHAQAFERVSAEQCRETLAIDGDVG